MALPIFDRNLIHDSWLEVNFDYLQDSNLLTKSKDNYYSKIIFKKYIANYQGTFLKFGGQLLCC